MAKLEPKRNVYVGHRYVPKIFGEWDQQNEYEGLSIVTHQGTSYTSKKRVPVGIDILNEEFWVVTGNYNAQVEYYRQETERVSKKLDSKTDNTDFDEFKENTNDNVNNINKKITKNENDIKFNKQMKDMLAVSIKEFDTFKQAINFARDNNLNLDWGNEHYVLTDNIPGFHEVKHIGHASIELDGNTFYLNPVKRETNTIFVGVNGNDDNIGISENTPFKTIQGALNYLRYRNEILPGNWKIKIGSGIFGGASITGFESLNRLEIEGTVNANNDPETVISGTLQGGTQGRFGIRVEPGIKDLLLSNVRFDDFDSSSTTYGFLIKTNGKATLNNCIASKCTLGFAGVNSTTVIFRDCTAIDCDTGYTVSYGSSGTFAGSNSSSRGKAIRCITGCSITRNAVAHVDYMDLEDCTGYGVHVNMGSRAHVLGSHFKRNKYGLVASGAGEWINNTTYKNFFYENTADENDINYSHFGVGRETRLTSQRSTNDFRTYINIPNRTMTGTTDQQYADVVSSSYYIPEYFLNYPGRKIKVVLTGRINGAGSKKVDIMLQNVNKTGGTGNGNDIIDTFDYNASAETKAFKIIAELDTMGDGKALTSSDRSVHLAGFNYASSLVKTLADVSEQKQLRIRTHLENPDSEIRIDKVEMYVAG